MAALGLSYNFYDGDGVTDTFSIGIDFLENSHLIVSVDDEILNEDNEYAIVGGNVVFDTPPGGGDSNVKIIRQTPASFATRLVDFAEQTYITEEQLELNQKQLFMLIQESKEADDSGTISPGAEYIRYSASRAMWLASRLGVATAIGGVKDPSSNDEVATKKYVDDVQEWGIAGIPQSWQFIGETGVLSYTLTDAANAETEMLIVAIAGSILAPNTDYAVLKGDPHSTLSFITQPTVGETILAINIGKARFINSALLDDGSVTGAKLVDETITAGKLADGAVTEAKLASSAVTAGKIASSAVSEDKVAALAITYGKLKKTGFTTTPGGSFDKVLIVDRNTGTLSLDSIASTDIVDWVTALGNTRLNSLAAPNAHLSMGGFKLTTLGTPTADADAATKKYVDDELAAGASSKTVLIFDQVLPTDRSDWDISPWSQAEYVSYRIMLSNFRGGGVASGLTTLSFWQSSGWQLDVVTLGTSLSPLITSFGFDFVINQPSGIKPFAYGGWPLNNWSYSLSLGSAVLGIRFRTNTATPFIAGTRVQIYGYKTLA